MPHHQHPLRVRYAETDQMGIVYHANYLVWFEIGRVELVRSLGFQYKDLERTHGLFLSVVEVQCRYHFPARYDDEIIVETALHESNARLIEFHYRIWRVSGNVLLASGRTRHCWLNREMRPARLPEEAVRVLSAAVSAGGGDQGKIWRK